MKNYIQNILFGCAFLLIGTPIFGQTTFNHTGSVQTFVVPTTGQYQLEVWGAQGGNDLDNPTTHFGGRGGYTSGELTLTAGQTLYIYVGSQGGGCLLANWHSSGGGGATDIRLVGGLWNDSSGLYSRIIVAGGGGGRHGNNQENAIYVGNDGGGLNAPSFVANGITVTGSTQTDGGSSTRNDELPGFFGYSLPHKNQNTCSVGGYNGASRGSDGWANGGAGGGWWGGCDSWPTSSGGSSYVLTATSVKPVGYTPTSTHWMNNDIVIAGNAVMPDPNGGNMTGNTGDGIARITLLCSPLNLTVTPTDTVCFGTPVTINGTSTGTGIITWDNGITNNVAFPNNTAGVTTYSSSSTDPNDCVSQVTINVLPATPVAIAAFTPDTVCETDPAINLPVGTPALGTYSGNGVVGTTFDPSTAGVGAHYVVYSFTDTNSCTNMDSTMIVVESCVGVDENGALAGVNIYPNPTNNIINITLGTITSDVNLTITSVEGKIVYQENNVSDNKVSVDLSNNSKGIYFLKVETNNQYKVYKVIKE